MKLVILDGEHVSQNDVSWDILSEFGELVVYDSTSPEEVIHRIGDAEYIFSGKVVIDKYVLQHTNIKYIGLLSTGYNHIDIEEVKKHNIVVSNVPNYSTYAVAQFTFALLLELCHHVSMHNRAVQDGEWIATKKFCFQKSPQIELLDKTFGIIGLGDIGARVAKIAESMGMHVAVFTRTQKSGYAYPFLDFDSFLHSSDIISIHCPLNEHTRELINATSISKMKDGVMIINTARGPICNEHDVAEALDSGKIAGLAVDVVCKEPMEKDCPLLGKKNCVITPHIAWLSKQTRVRLVQLVKDNFQAYLNGTPKNMIVH